MAATVKTDISTLMSFLDHDPQPAIVMDTEYNVLAANVAYRRQFSGPNEDTPVGRKCYAVSHHYSQPCDRSGEDCPMATARQTKSAYRVLHIHYTPRGQEHVDVELVPILGDAGQIVAYVEKLSTVKSASVQASKNGLVGSSKAFNDALAQLNRVAPTELPVLLLGESGTGKELFARAVHEASPRKRAPFVVVDCSGLTDTLFESELFGYEKGAFTGAQVAKPGLVETAKGGTLFLDEIGDVPLSMQVKLLRLLEAGTYRRVGSVETRNADFRLVAATHKPLEKMIESGEFRADLYYRICVFPIELPALRTRSADIPTLVQSLLKRGSGPLGMQYEIDDDAMQALIHYPWPGNIRELKNAVDRARLFADEGHIRLEHLPPNLQKSKSHLPQSESKPAPAGKGIRARRLSPKELLEMLNEFEGSRKALAEHLGISERTLYRKLEQAGERKA